MFDNKTNRYMTSAIAEELHPEIASILWQLIDVKRGLNIELDYLQVFELTVSNGKQVIVHRQEVPEMQSLLMKALSDAKPITRKIWCMDSGETEMMLFQEDY